MISGAHDVLTWLEQLERTRAGHPGQYLLLLGGNQGKCDNKGVVVVVGKQGTCDCSRLTKVRTGWRYMDPCWCMPTVVHATNLWQQPCGLTWQQGAFARVVVVINLAFKTTVTNQTSSLRSRTPEVVTGNGRDCDHGYNCVDSISGSLSKQ